MENEALEKDIKKLRRDLKINRVLSITTIVLMLCLLIPLLQVLQQIQGTVEPVVEQISEVDMDTLNSSLGSLKVVAEELAAADIDWQQLSETINELDVDALNETLQGLDTEELTETLANLNAACESLQALESRLGFSFF